MTGSSIHTPKLERSESGRVFSAPAPSESPRRFMESSAPAPSEGGTRYNAQRDPSPPPSYNPIMNKAFLKRLVQMRKPKGKDELTKEQRLRLILEILNLRSIQNGIQLASKLENKFGDLTQAVGYYKEMIYPLHEFYQYLNITPNLIFTLYEHGNSMDDIKRKLDNMTILKERNGDVIPAQQPQREYESKVHHQSQSPPPRPPSPRFGNGFNRFNSESVSSYPRFGIGRGRKYDLNDTEVKSYKQSDFRPIFNRVNPFASTSNSSGSYIHNGLYGHLESDGDSDEEPCYANHLTDTEPENSDSEMFDNSDDEDRIIRINADGTTSVMRTRQQTMDEYFEAPPLYQRIDSEPNEFQIRNLDDDYNADNNDSEYSNGGKYQREKAKFLEYLKKSKKE
jgi:hypothetical protein